MREHTKGKKKYKHTKTMSDTDSTSNVDIFATERSFEVEDLSPPESSPISQNHRGPEPY